MSTQTVLYDLPSKQGTAWSLNPWKTRLILNFKSIDYKTEWVEFPDVEPTMKSFNLPPNPKDAPGYFTDYSIPTVRFSDGTYMMDSWPIAHELEKRYPSPSLHLSDPVTIQVRDQISKILGPVFPQLLSAVAALLPERSQDYFYRSREAAFGKSLAEVHESAVASAEESWARVEGPLKEIVALLKVHEGPFFLGKEVAYADFIFVAALYFVKRLSEEAFLRIVGADAVLGRVWEATQPWFGKDD